MERETETERKKEESVKRKCRKKERENESETMMTGMVDWVLARDSRQNEKKNEASFDNSFSVHSIYHYPILMQT